MGITFSTPVLATACCVGLAVVFAISSGNDEGKKDKTKLSAEEVEENKAKEKKRKKLMANRFETKKACQNPTVAEYYTGMFAATIISSIYIIAPIWLFISFYFVIFHTFDWYAWVICFPVLLSAVTPTYSSNTFLQRWPFRHMPAYFQYEEIVEIPHEEIRKLMEKRNILFCVQPHGVFSYGGACAGIEWSRMGWFDVSTCPTAAASVVLKTPLLKHVVGIFGLVDASRNSLVKQLKKANAVLYIGGIAELFLSCKTEEKLFIKKRKGFIKLALQSGAEIMPIYFLGNTEAMHVAKGPLVRKLARALGMSITCIWGRWYTLIPEPVKCVGILGKPLGIPQIENPTDEDITKYHDLYVSEVERLFETYKDLSPSYAEKELTFE